MRFLDVKTAAMTSEDLEQQNKDALASSNSAPKG